MPQDSNCVVCNAQRPNLVGICTECEGCMAEHCDCPICQHGKARVEACFFCGRGNVALFSAVVQADDIDADLEWLMNRLPYSS